MSRVLSQRMVSKSRKLWIFCNLKENSATRAARERGVYPPETVWHRRGLVDKQDPFALAGWELSKIKIIIIIMKKTKFYHDEIIFKSESGTTKQCSPLRLEDSELTEISALIDQCCIGSEPSAPVGNLGLSSRTTEFWNSFFKLLKFQYFDKLMNWFEQQYFACRHASTTRNHATTSPGRDPVGKKWFWVDWPPHLPREPFDM